MEDTQKEPAEQTHSAEGPGTETPTPDEKSDRDELKEVASDSPHTHSSWCTPGYDICEYAAREIPRIFRERWARIYSWAGNVCTQTANNVDTIVDEAKKDTD